MNKYLVSGVSPSTGGVGRLMRSLIVEANNQGYKVITRRNKISINSLTIKRLVSSNNGTNQESFS